MYNRLLQIAMFSMVLNIFFTPFNASISILFGYTTIIAFWLYPFLGLLKRKVINRLGFVLIFLFTGALISFILSLQFLNSKNLIDQVKPFISFVAFYLAVSQDNKDSIKMDLRYFFNLNYFLCFVFLVFAFGPFEFKYTVINKWGGKIFTMGLGNPNAVSMYVLFSSMLLILQLKHIKRRAHIVFNLVLFALQMVILLMLGSRTVMICVLMVFFVMLLKKTSVLWKVVTWFAVTFPFIMVAIHLFLLNFKDVEFLGKSLSTGRAEIFIEVFEKIAENPMNYIFGQYFEHCLYNYHNAPVTILASFGVVGMIFYFIFWIEAVRYLNFVCDDNTQQMALIVLLSFFINASSESALMIGSTPFSLMTLVLILIAKGDLVYSKDNLNPTWV